jgi:hypothetical protein
MLIEIIAAMIEAYTSRNSATPVGCACESYSPVSAMPGPFLRYKRGLMPETEFMNDGRKRKPTGRNLFAGQKGA